MSLTRMLSYGVTALLLSLYACDREDEDEKPSLTDTGTVELPENLFTGRQFDIKSAASEVAIKLTDSCTGAELYQLQGDKLQKGALKTNAKGEATGIFYISRTTLPDKCKLAIGDEQFAISSSVADDNAAHGLINFLGKWQRKEDTGNELQIGLGAKPQAAAQLFVTVDGGNKWQQHQNLLWQEDQQANKTSLTYNSQNTAHNQALLQVGEHWSFIAVPATEQVFMQRMFKVSNIWHQGEVQVKVDGIAAGEAKACMSGINAFHIHGGKVQQFTTNGLTLTPDASGSLDNILLIGTANANCAYVLRVGGALTVLDVGNDSAVPSISEINLTMNNSKVQVTLPPQPTGVDANIELYVLDEFLEWHQDDVTAWATPISTEIGWGGDKLHHALLKVTKSKTDYWFYQ